MWNGKLHAAIRSVLKDGLPEDVSVDETSDGSLRLQVTYVNMWDWTSGDSLDLTLALNPETFAVVGYTWELNKDPAKNPGLCLTYKGFVAN